MLTPGRVVALLAAEVFVCVEPAVLVVGFDSLVRPVREVSPEAEPDSDALALPLPFLESG